MISSQSSFDPDIGSGSADTVSNISVNGKNRNDAGIEPGTVTSTRRRRWTFSFRRKGDGPSTGKVKFKSLSISCQCKSVVKGSCLIILASFVELLGCLVCLVLGISYVVNACNFYQLESDPDSRAKDYEEKLENLGYLEENGVGFVGLLATCIIGIMIAFLMPIGTIYKSWKCLRASMTLLFSVSFVQVILVTFYVESFDLLMSGFAIPFRMYEIFLISSYIKYYKKKKIEELKERVQKAGMAGASTTSSQLGFMALESASLCSMDKDDILDLVQFPMPIDEHDHANKTMSEMQVTFDMTDAKMGEGETPQFLKEDELTSPDTKKKSKKRKLLGWQKQEKRKPRVHAPDRFVDYSEYK